MAKKQIKVTIVEQRGEGGMIHYAYQLCSALAKSGAEVTLITTPTYELNNLPHNFEVKRIMRLWTQIDPILYSSPKNIFEAGWRKLFWSARRALRAVRLIIEWSRVTLYLIKHRPDIVQFGELDNTVEIPFLILMQKTGLTLSQICHEFEKRETDRNLIKTLNNKLSLYIYRTFSAIFVHGEENRRLFLSLFDVPHEKVHSIQHGNEQIFGSATNPNELMKQLQKKYGLQDTDKVILFFGNLTPSKGIPDLIQAFSSINASSPTTKLIIAGMPSKLVNISEFKQLAEDLKISSSVIFDSRYIPMEEIEPLMRLATVAVYPYRNISQSGALQVAYAFGVPVVATNTGGFPEAVEDGKSGYLVPVESPQELANAILKVITNPILATEMGAYAKHLSETKFAWEPIADSIIEIYTSILSYDY